MALSPVQEPVCVSSLLAHHPTNTSHPNEAVESSPALHGPGDWHVGEYEVPSARCAGTSESDNGNDNSSQVMDEGVEDGCLYGNYRDETGNTGMTPHRSHKRARLTDIQGPVRWTVKHEEWLAFEVLRMLAHVSPAKKRSINMEVSDMESAIDWETLQHAFFIRFGLDRPASVFKDYVKVLGLVERARMISLQSMGFLGRAPTTLLGRFDSDRSSIGRFVDLSLGQQFACVEREWICWMLGGQMSPNWAVAADRFSRHFGRPKTDHEIRSNLGRILFGVDPARPAETRLPWAVSAGPLHCSLCCALLDVAHEMPAEDNYCEIREFIFVSTDKKYSITILGLQSEIKTQFGVDWPLSWVGILRSMAKETRFYTVATEQGLYRPQNKELPGGQNVRWTEPERGWFVESARSSLRFNVDDVDWSSLASEL